MKLRAGSKENVWLVCNDVAFGVHDRFGMETRTEMHLGDLMYCSCSVDRLRREHDMRVWCSWLSHESMCESVNDYFV